MSSPVFDLIWSANALSFIIVSQELISKVFNYFIYKEFDLLMYSDQYILYTSLNYILTAFIYTKIVYQYRIYLGIEKKFTDKLNNLIIRNPDKLELYYENSDELIGYKMYDNFYLSQLAIVNFLGYSYIFHTYEVSYTTILYVINYLYSFYLTRKFFNNYYDLEFQSIEFYKIMKLN